MNDSLIVLYVRVGQQVKHLSWRYLGGYFVCNGCGSMQHRLSLYCPNCGAQMDGEV